MVFLDLLTHHVVQQRHYVVVTVSHTVYSKQITVVFHRFVYFLSKCQPAPSFQEQFKQNCLFCSMGNGLHFISGLAFKIFNRLKSYRSEYPQHEGELGKLDQLSAGITCCCVKVLSGKRKESLLQSITYELVFLCKVQLDQISEPHAKPIVFLYLQSLLVSICQHLNEGG